MGGCPVLRVGLTWRGILSFWALQFLDSKVSAVLGAMTISVPLNLKWDVINMLGYRGEQLTQRDTVTK